MRVLQHSYRHLFIAITLFFGTFLLSACDSQQTITSDSRSTDGQELASSLNVSNDRQAMSPKKNEMIKLTGTIVYQDMEGGFFGFIDENGQKYTPIGIPKTHLRDGLVVALTGERLPNMITLTQFGESIKVQHIEIIDESNASQPGHPKSNIDER